MIVVGLLFLLASTAHVLSEGTGGNHQAQCIEKEKEALLSFKRDVDPGNILSSWTNNSTNYNCCTWRGVTCDNQTNHVVKIDLRGVYDDNYIDGHDYAIGGEIGSSLVELKNLKYLDFTGSNFSRIPKFIGSLKNLEYLDLSENPLGGTIPPELGNLTRLQFLYISRNFRDSNRTLIVDNFEWLSHLTSLRKFYLANSNFTKAGLQSFKVPPFLSWLEVSNCLLPKVDASSLSHTNYSSNFLETLIIRESSIHPTAITWFLNSSCNLVELLIIYNIIDGPFPDSFRKRNYLEYVALSGNEVESGVPKSLGNLTNLKALDFCCNNHSGILHDLLENLAGTTKNSLDSLELHSNRIRGLILDDEKTFPFLTRLTLHSNRLQGPFPNHLSRFPSLQELSLDDNQLTGPLPDLSSMSSLVCFSAARNKFNAISTESIGKLSYLKTLDVSSNNLTGVISGVLIQWCPNLKELDFSYNSVSLKINSSWVPSFQLTSLKLASCKLGPQFPSWVQTQSKLSHLDISNSEISGSVPNWFSNISSSLIYLNMSFNFLNNLLPYFPVYANYVDLSFNQFYGSVPPCLANVSSLFLSNNNFTDFRSYLCDTKEAAYQIDLSNNQLSGELPDCWGKFDELIILDLGNNKLSGEIPSSICSSFYMQTLQLRHNNFSGKLPSSLKNCTWLQVFDVGKNNLKGTIPSWIGERLTKLVFLNLKSNKFYGSIPSNLCSLPKIQILDLSVNDLSGAIPSCINNFTSMVQMEDISAALRPELVLGSYYLYYTNIASIMWKGVEHEYRKILGLLRIINLSSNKLTGEIPLEATYLVQLVQLNLSRNNLSGGIPQKIGNLTKLESLDLSHNMISGQIPLSLAGISTLSFLDLSNNGLSGRIPTGTQLQSFNDSMYTMNLGLCGPPLTSSCPGDETLHDPSDSIHEEDGGEWFDKSWFYIGIGVGFTIGFCGVCGNLLINTSWRHAYFRFMNSLGDWLYVIITVKVAALRRKLAAWH